MRSAADAAAIAASHRARGGQQDSLSAPALSLRAGPDRRVLAPIPSDCDCPFLGTSHPVAAREESVFGQTKASAPWQALAAVREAPAGSPTAARCEVSGANPGHATP